jgi:hypothetical protein
MGKTRYRPYGGGWLLVFHKPTKDREVLMGVRFAVSAVSGERLVPMEIRGWAGRVVTEGDRRPILGDPLRAADLRAFPLGAVEAAANSEYRQALLDRLEDEQDLWSDSAGKEQAKARRAAKATASADAGLSIPAGREYGDDFYRQVADVYGRLAASTHRPAAVIAERNGVPVRTVHRWVYEARRRGFLPGGSRGKAG